MLEATRTEIRMYSRAKNPAWENFLDLFTAIDKGAKGKREISAFNGGLFADDPAINALELAEEKWTNAFAGFGNYDFSEEVNVEVLGHLFERSITELEKLRVGGLFALKAGAEDAAAGQRHGSAGRRGKKREGQAGRRRVAALEDAQERPAEAVRHLLHAPRLHRPDRRADRRRAGGQSALPHCKSSTRSIPRPATNQDPAEAVGLLDRLPGSPQGA